MAMTLTRPLGALTLGVAATAGARIVTQQGSLTAAKLWMALAGLTLIGLPLWAGQEDGGVIEIGEGAFDGLAALIGLTVATFVTPEPQGFAQVMSQSAGDSILSAINLAHQFPRR